MNTIDELISFGISYKNAERMIDSYNSRIGYKSGCNVVTDITYIGEGTKVIEMKCCNCGNVCTKEFNNGSNKFQELRKTCVVCNEANLKNSEKSKKAVLRNDNEEFLGKKYGDFVIEGFEYIPNNKSGNTIKWKCKCVECGIEIIKLPARLKNGKNNKCECSKTKEVHSEVGKKYNKLTISDVFSKGKSHNQYAHCVCDCGNEKDIQLYYVKQGIVKSCGCIAKEIQENAISNSPVYGTWNGMKQRCYNENHKKYKDYGGRGVTVCDEWLNDFGKFEEWCFDNGYRPNCGLTLDRIDVNGDYEPQNCRFANIYVQNVNRRPARRKKITIDGVSKYKKEWLEDYGISGSLVRYRQNKMGMTFEQALKAEKLTEGNHYAALNLSKRKKNDVVKLNKCQSYIETNLYMAFLRAETDYVLEPQYRILKYRVDFFEKTKKLVIECDGYDYHKTKEQIESDCKRERDLITNGYTVIRFSGSEINKNPDDCVKEILEILDKMEGGVEYCQGQQMILKNIQ